MGRQFSERNAYFEKTRAKISSFFALQNFWGSVRSDVRKEKKKKSKKNKRKNPKTTPKVLDIGNQWIKTYIFWPSVTAFIVLENDILRLFVQFVGEAKKERKKKKEKRKDKKKDSPNIWKHPCSLAPGLAGVEARPPGGGWGKPPLGVAPDRQKKVPWTTLTIAFLLFVVSHFLGK